MENFNVLYRKHREEIFTFVNKHLRDDCTSEEIVNDVFLRIYNNLEKFDSTRGIKIRTWMYAIAKNVMIDYTRSKAYGVSLKTLQLSDMGSNDPDDDNNHIEFEDTEVTPDHKYDNELLKRRIIKAMKSLPMKQRRMVNMFFNCELSYEEVSEKMNVPLGTIKGTLNRARKKLQNDLVNA